MRKFNINIFLEPIIQTDQLNIPQPQVNHSMHRRTGSGEYYVNNMNGMVPNGPVQVPVQNGIQQPMQQHVTQQQQQQQHQSMHRRVGSGGNGGFSNGIFFLFLFFICFLSNFGDPSQSMHRRTGSGGGYYAVNGNSPQPLPLDQSSAQMSIPTQSLQIPGFYSGMCLFFFFYSNRYFLQPFFHFLILN